MTALGASSQALSYCLYHETHKTGGTSHVASRYGSSTTSRSVASGSDWSRRTRLGREKTRGDPLEPIDIDELARRLREQRSDRGLSLRVAAEEAGVPFNTFGRVERGYTPDLGNYARLTAWLGLDPGTFFPEPGRRRDDDTTATIRTHLHADPFLTEEAAERIAGLVDDLYRNLAAPAGETEIHLRASSTFTPDAGDQLATMLEHMQDRLLADPALSEEPGWVQGG